MRLGESTALHIERTPTGCWPLDIALGGGWPKGRTVEVYGPESSGKTTLALHAIAEVQKAGGNAVLVDAEHAFNDTYAARLGVDIKNLLICQPQTGEQALQVS
jgi:recombination protein RecA